MRRAAPRKPRAPKKPDCKMMCCTTPPEAVARIRADVERWEAGKWAVENNYGPACNCGLRTAKGACGRHGAGTDAA